MRINFDWLDESRRERIGGWLFMGVLALLFAAGAFYIREDEMLAARDRLPFTMTVRLHATITQAGNDLIVVNEDDYDWAYVKLQINTGLQDGGYIFRTRKLGAGKAHIIDTGCFINEYGEPFSPQLLALRNLSVWCDTPFGYGYWYREWDQS